MAVKTNPDALCRLASVSASVQAGNWPGDICAECTLAVWGALPVHHARQLLAALPAPFANSLVNDIIITCAQRITLQRRCTVKHLRDELA